MILNKTWSIEEDSGGFVLIEKTEGHIRKDGKLTDETKIVEKKYYYGCVYQALKGFLKRAIGTIFVGQKNTDDLKTKVEEIVRIINDAETEIKEKFSIEVLVSGRTIKEKSIEKD